MDEVKNCNARGDVKTRQFDSPEPKGFCFLQENVGTMPDRDVKTIPPIADKSGFDFILHQN